jgi:predicted amidophosphoribosyltransferase
MLRAALEVVFPPRCAGCARGPWPFCAGCLARLQAIGPPWCRRCGAPGVDAPGCPSCPPATIDRARAAFRYAGPAKQAIHRLKFGGWRSVGAALADAVATLDIPPVDAVTWVPLGRRRLGERGFDQARALATAVGSRLDRPVVPLCRRTSSLRGSQARRGAAERRAAAVGSFTPNGRPAPGRVLLIDDVLTTGATAGDCARAIREAGASIVVLATVARSLRRAQRVPGGAGPRGRAYTHLGSRPGLWLPGDPPR